jgi:putative transposase
MRRQEAIDAGQLPGVTSTDLAELSKARRRIADLEAELEIDRRATDLLKEAVPPNARFAAITTLAAEGFSVDLCCRVLNVSVSPLGFVISPARCRACRPAPGIRWRRPRSG